MPKREESPSSAAVIALAEWETAHSWTCTCKPRELRAEVGGRLECGACGRIVQRLDQAAE